ncbi:hypothetical protein PVK06_016798 [Gossypium arboreum]|uniref:Uncharacterized protein n=1 Tax=Gossypium arboreum TaxID=29729 RepID=A0ABR0Q0W8_GOSAR|nr:hypothetical protein PVK06_016798 [Gossypium arboreum]
MDTTFCEVMLAGGSWDWNFWHCMVDGNAIPFTAGILPPNPFIGQDELISNWSTNGGFIVKSTYNHLMQNSLKPVDNKWKSA